MPFAKKIFWYDICCEKPYENVRKLSLFFVDTENRYCIIEAEKDKRRKKERKKMKFGYETWHTKQIGNTISTFKVLPSGNFVIQSIHRDGKDLTSSITTNRYVSGMIRWGIANGQIEGKF